MDNLVNDYNRIHKIYWPRMAGRMGLSALPMAANVLNLLSSILYHHFLFYVFSVFIFPSTVIVITSVTTSDLSIHIKIKMTN